MAQDNENPYASKDSKSRETNLPEISSDQELSAQEKEDAREPTVGEILCYSTAGVTGGLNNQTLGRLFQPLLNIGLGISPVMIGFMLSFKSLWDGFTDPIMAMITDNWKGKNGRRRPFILWGGIIVAVAECIMWWVVSRNWDPRVVWYANKYFWFFLSFRLFLATAQTVFSVPYWALGIELSPSYHGKTRVFAVRSIFQKVANFAGPWLYPFCLLPFFVDSLEGVRYLSLMLSIIMIAGVLFTYHGTRERRRRPSKKKHDIFKAMGLTFQNRHFLKIVAIYIFLSWTMGIFNIIGMYLNIYYVYQGNVMRGALLAAYIGSFATGLAIVGVPVTTWICKRFQKHNALRFSLLMVMIGKLLGWWLINPTYPWLQVFIPFFFSFGISSFYLTLSTMFADVVDVDELVTGERREGIFGACNAWVMKTSGALTAALAGIVLAMTGFDIDLGRAQTAQAIFNMRVCFCLLPSILLGTGFLLLWKYPLTEKVMADVQDELKIRRARVSDCSARL